MKIQTKNLIKSIVSIALCLSMVLSTPLMAFAADNDGGATQKKADIVYVSIGDSMTNGYCLDGYDGESGAANYAMNTYSNKFAAYLAGYDGEIEDDQVIFEGNRIVDHRQLAISGMRAQDIQWVLELDYTNDSLMQAVYNTWYNSTGFNENTWYNTWGFNGDAYTWSELCKYDYRYADGAAKILDVYHNGNGTGYFTSSYATKDYINAAVNGIANDSYFPESKAQANQIGGYKYLQIITEFYHKSIEEADIISIAVGNTNFGTHMLSSIINVVMANDLSFSRNFNLAKMKEIAYADEYIKSKVDTILESESYQDMLAMCQSLADNNEAKEKEIAYIVEYCMIAYINGYISMLEFILDVNPDVEIIQIPLMNAYEGANGIIEAGTLGELAEVIYTPVNELLESLLPDYNEKYEEANFYLSEDVSVSCMVDVFGDDFYKDANGNFVTYPGPLEGDEEYTANTSSVVRNRFVEEIACGDLLFAAFDKMGGSPKMQKKNTQTNINNFLYGGEVESVDGSKYNGCGVAYYDLMTDTEKAAYAATNSVAAKEYALYLAFEYSIILSGTKNVTLEALANLSNAATIFASAYGDIQAAINAAAPNYFEAAAPVVAAGSNGQLNSDDVMAIMNAYQSGDQTVLGMVSYNIVAEKTNDMIADLMGSDGSLSISLTGTDIYTLCTASSFTDAVCNFIAAKSDGQLTAAQVKTLVASEKGVWAVAGEKVDMDADFIEKAYGYGMLDDEQKAGIELLFKVREAALTFIGYESMLKDSVAALQSNIPTIIESTSTLAYLLSIPNSMGYALYSDSNLQGALCMNARCVLGTGAGAHPSVGGHHSLYESILGTFNQSITYEWSEDYSTCTAHRGEYASETVESISTVITPVTCINTGKVSYSAVFETYWALTQTMEVDIPVIPHDYEEIVTEPTCYAKGYTTYTCKVAECKHTYTGNETEIIPHDYEEIVTEPTCYAKGYTTYTCKVAECKHTYTDKETEVIPHDYAATVTDPTCEEGGYTTYVCKVEECKHTYTGDEVPELGHDYEEFVTEPTCTEGGYTTYICKNDSTHTYTGNETEKLGHSYGEDGRCENLLPDGTVCGVYNLEQFGQCAPNVNAELTSGSTLDTKFDGTDAGKFTYVNTGSGWTIVDENGKYLAADANGNFVLSDSAYNWNYSDGKFSTTVKVPGTSWIEQLLGLTKDATYYLAYSNGAATVNATGSAVTFSTTASNGYHTFNGVTVIEPTCTEEGHTERVCIVCGETFKTDITSSLGHNHVPTVHAPECESKGYTEYTCGNCGDVYTDAEVPALGHNIVDGVCENCGEPDYVITGECNYKSEVSLSGGTYTLALNGTEVGSYTFSSVSGGWAIKDANGKYLALDANGNVVTSGSAYAWTYSNGQFSGTVSKAGSSWLDKLLGKNTSTTYYLVASGSGVASSTSGATATFFTGGVESYHNFEIRVVAPTCSEEGYTERLCSRCGYSYKNNFVSATGHHYVHASKDATCTENGGDVYTCNVCGDSYIENVITAPGHNFVNGICSVCGASEEPDCVYVAEKSITEGKLDLVLNGTEVGSYTFTSVSGGWAIKNANGKYIALSGSSVVESDSAFTWTYSNGRFSASSSKASGNWLEALLNSSRKTTYYLVASGSGLGTSTSSSKATAKFYQEIVGGEHSYGSARPSAGNHIYVCENCGYAKTVVCGDSDCVICNASVVVSVRIENGASNWLQALLGVSSKRTVTITAEAEGTEVSTIEYSLDGKTWTKGTKFTSSSEVTSFQIRVGATNGQSYKYSYNNGNIIPM